MKKRLLTSAVAMLLAGNMLFVSCIGSFGLTNHVLKWNNTLSNKAVNQVVYMLFNIVPVYFITSLVDFFVTNTIEFWTGDKVFAEGTTREIKTDDDTFRIQVTQNGYHIDALGAQESIDFVYSPDVKSWSYIYNGQEHVLFFVDGDHAIVPLPDGTARRVALNQMGVETLKNVLEGQRLVAAR